MGENREGKQGRSFESVCCLGRVFILLTAELSRAQGKDWAAFKIKKEIFFKYNIDRNSAGGVVASPQYLQSLFPNPLDVQPLCTPWFFFLTLTAGLGSTDSSR